MKYLITSRTYLTTLKFDEIDFRRYHKSQPNSAINFKLGQIILYGFTSIK